MASVPALIRSAMRFVSSACASGANGGGIVAQSDGARPSRRHVEGVDRPSFLPLLARLASAVLQPAAEFTYRRPGTNKLICSDGAA